MALMLLYHILIFYCVRHISLIIKKVVTLSIYLKLHIIWFSTIGQWET